MDADGREVPISSAQLAFCARGTDSITMRIC
jgi:hypothetical protein